MMYPTPRQLGLIRFFFDIAAGLALLYMCIYAAWADWPEWLATAFWFAGVLWMFRMLMKVAKAKYAITFLLLSALPPITDPLCFAHCMQAKGDAPQCIIDCQ